MKSNRIDESDDPAEGGSSRAIYTCAIIGICAVIVLGVVHAYTGDVNILDSISTQDSDEAPSNESHLLLWIIAVLMTVFGGVLMYSISYIT